MTPNLLPQNARFFKQKALYLMFVGLSKGGMKNKRACWRVVIGSDGNEISSPLFRAKAC